MRRLLVVGLLAASAPAAFAQEPVDRAMIARIRTEGLEHSQVLQMFDTLATVIGPRLTAGSAFVRSVKWSRDKFAAWGLTGARLEPFPFGRAWELDRMTLEM